MRPIARFLLRAGISYREFADVSKAAFVNVATSDYGIRGRPTNVSRVAVMTGLTRKEVKRIRERSVQGAELLSRRSATADVLHCWFTDPKYLTGESKPKTLSYAGDGISFSTLVRACAGDIPPGAMRTELKRVGAIVEHVDGSLEAVKREVVSADIDRRIVDGLNLGLRPLATTIAYNVNPELNGGARFQRVVFSQQVPLKNLESIQKTATEKLTRFSEELDDDLAIMERSDSNESDQVAANVGVGLFYFVEEE
jgi:hypothetical protein